MTKIHRAASRPTKVAPASYFTGTVYQDDVLTGELPSKLRTTLVTFTPGARTNWHTHPVSQSLYVVSGVGRYQEKGKPVQVILPGDTVVIPRDVVHWHGAAPDHQMAHLAITEANEKGEVVVWLEPVSDADYKQPPAA